MKKSISTAFLCIIIFSSQTMAQNRKTTNTIAPITPSVLSSYNNRIQNYFGLTDNKDLPLLFNKYMLIDNISSSVPALEAGTLIYIDRPNQKRIPESLGNNDLVVLENNNNVRFHYSLLTVDNKLSLFSFRNIKEPMELGKTSFKSSFYKSFALEINKNNIFLNPILFLKPSQMDDKEKKFVLGSVLLESGIYSRFITNNQPLRIPLRKDFNIYVYAYEKPVGTYHKALPRSIQVSIKEIETGEVVFDQTMNFTNIQENKFNNQLNASDLYRKYRTIKMIKIGNWAEKDRLSSYLLTVKAFSFYNVEAEMNFEVSFY